MSQVPLTQSQFPVIGVEPFHRVVYGARNDGSTFEISLCDLLDSSITQEDSKGGNVRCQYIKDTHSKVIGMNITDTNKYGFRNIMNNNGESNQLNWGHYDQYKHESNNVFSKFGRGFKAACVKFADHIIIITKCYNDITGKYKCFKIIYDIQMMTSGNIPPGKDREPIWENMPEDAFLKEHGYEYGTTIKLSHLHRTSQIPTNWHDALKRTEMCLSECYSDFIRTEYSDIRIGILGMNDEMMTKILPMDSPFQITNYPHRHVGYDVIMFMDESDDIVDIYANYFSIIDGVKKISPRYFKFFLTNSGTRSKLDNNKISKKQFEEDTKMYSNDKIITAKFHGTNTYGYSKFDKLTKWQSIHLKRNLTNECSRTLSKVYTEDTNGNVKSYNNWGFLTKKSNGEWNHQILELLYKDQCLDNRFGQTTSKNVIAPCDNGTLFGEVFQFLETRIRSSDKKKGGLGSSTNWNNAWVEKYDKQHTFQTSKSYDENLSEAGRKLDKLSRAIYNFETFKNLKPGSIGVTELESSSAGLEGWAKHNPNNEPEYTDEINNIDISRNDSNGDDSTDINEDYQQIQLVMNSLQAKSIELVGTGETNLPNIEPSDVIVNNISYNPHLLPDTDSTDNCKSDIDSKSTERPSHWKTKQQKIFEPFQNNSTDMKHEVYFRLAGRFDGEASLYTDAKGIKKSINHSIKFGIDKDGYILGKIGITNQIDRDKGSNYSHFTVHARAYVEDNKSQIMKEGLLKAKIKNLSYTRSHEQGPEHFLIKEEDLNKFCAEFYKVISV